MKKFMTLVVDDEEAARVHITNILTSQQDLAFEIHEASSYADAVELLQKHRFKLSIIDNELGIKSGFELFDAFERDRFGFVVYMSKIHDGFMPLARKMRQDEELLKPFGRDDVARVLLEFAKHNSSQDFITVKDKGMLVRLPIHDLMYIEIDGDLLSFYFVHRDSPYHMTGRLSRFKFLFAFSNFHRCSRSVIINSDYLFGVNKTDAFLELVSTKRNIEHSSDRIGVESNRRKILIQYSNKEFIAWLNSNGFDKSTTTSSREFFSDSRK